MRERTSVTTDAAGRRVVAKVAGNAEEADRLQREARQLEVARHPGVVELVGADGHGAGSILLTAHVDGPTLATVGRLPLEETAGLLAALATTLADLHDLGLVHGAVAPEHVVIGPGGRPVLCSLGYGGGAGDPVGAVPALPGPFTDPARAEAHVLSPAFDVFALGALARFLAPDPPAGHVLARVADEATSDDASARPSARAVAGVVQQEVPAVRLPRGLPSPPLGRPAAATVDPLAAWRRQSGALGGHRRPARPRAVAAVGAGVAVAVGAAAFLVARSPAAVPDMAGPAPAVELSDPLPPDEVEPGPPTTRAGLASSTTTSTTPAVPRADCPRSTSVLQADVDGDGCLDAMRYADGVLQAGAFRWAVGRPGDQVATGDWACQGARTIALFRPATGEVFRFEGWASAGRDLTTAAVTTVPGGQALRAGDVDGDGCHEAVVERATGPAAVVRLP